MKKIIAKIKNNYRYATQELWLTFIAAYGFFQSIVTVKNVIKNLSVGPMESLLAGINTFLLLVSIFVFIGAIGIILLKRWGLTVTKLSYIAVILLITQIIYINQKADFHFLLLRAIDIAIAAIVLCYLAKKKVADKFS